MGKKKQFTTLEEIEIAKAAVLEILQSSESEKNRLQAARLLIELQKAQELLRWI